MVDVIEYKGLYTVDSDGNIYNLKSGRQMRYRSNGKGYMLVNLSNNGKVTTHKVHRLVMTSFYPEVDHTLTVDHIDGNKANNAITNLRWCTHKENVGFYYENNPNKKAKPSIKVYGTREDMRKVISKPIIVNGFEWSSIHAASKHIASIENKNENTIRKELRNYVQGKRMEWCMYGKYNIGW